MKFPRETERPELGWEISYDYLSLIKEMVDTCELENSVSLEQIEVVLLSIEANEIMRTKKW